MHEQLKNKMLTVRCLSINLSAYHLKDDYERTAPFRTSNEILIL